jgi:hypothetical protein
MGEFLLSTTEVWYAGFVADPVGRLIKRTLLNPYLTVPILLVAKYTAVGQWYALSNEALFRAVTFLAYWGVLRVVNNFLNRWALSNGVADQYDWRKEVVVVTGGSDRIGKTVVELLAEYQIKVAMLDI